MEEENRKVKGSEMSQVAAIPHLWAQLVHVEYTALVVRQAQYAYIHTERVVPYKPFKGAGTGPSHNLWLPSWKDV